MGPLMTLRTQFSACVTLLLVECNRRGYLYMLDETKRDPRVAALNAKSGAGIKNSLHIVGLAIDIDLIKDGVLLTKTEQYSEVGAYWVGLHPLSSWGGDFGDGRHFSFRYQGRR